MEQITYLPHFFFLGIARQHVHFQLFKRNHAPVVLPTVNIRECPGPSPLDVVALDVLQEQSERKYVVLLGMLQNNFPEFATILGGRQAPTHLVEYRWRVQDLVEQCRLLFAGVSASMTKQTYHPNLIQESLSIFDRQKLGRFAGRAVGDTFQNATKYALNILPLVSIKLRCDRAKKNDKEPTLSNLSAHD